MDTHVKVAAWLRIGYSGLGLLAALFIFVFLGGVGALVGASGEADAVQAAPWIVLFEAGGVPTRYPTHF
jgi:hypothetical protein